MVQYAVVQRVEEIDIQTVFEDEERRQEEFHRDLEAEAKVSDNLAVTAGGITSGAIGGDATSQRAQQAIANSEALKETDFRVNVGTPVPGFEDLGTQLADGEFNGEIGAAVEGYPVAMSRLTNELRRLMRDGNRLLVVWLFDESDSMKNDQQEISDEFQKG